MKGLLKYNTVYSSLLIVLRLIGDTKLSKEKEDRAFIHVSSLTEFK